MNITVYLFGEFNQGYTQYPDDYTKSIFHNFYANAKSTTQIAVHREGCLMYYGYIRKLEQECYIGFCVVLNELMLIKLDELFLLNENIISNLITKGQLIHFNEQGEIVSYVDRLYMNREEIDIIIESFYAGFRRLENSIQPLPTVKYGILNSSVKNFLVEDNIEEIVESSHTYGYTYIYKSESYNTKQLSSYKNVLAQLNRERTALDEKYNELTKEHKKILKQKKQYRFVIILFIILLGFGIGLFFLNDNLNNTKNALTAANETITLQSDSLDSKKLQIANLNDRNRILGMRYQEECSLRKKAEISFSNFKNMIGERQPFVIISTSFNFDTGYLYFKYFGLKEGSIKLQVRAYNDDGYSYSNNANIDIILKENKSRIYVGHLNAQKWYSFEILRGNIILGGGRH